MEEQPVPEEANCPSCGESPTEDSVVEHRLSNMGYLHDDIRLECSECSERWTLGVPINNEREFGDDLICDSCESSRMLVHRLRVVKDDYAKLDLKCPNCKYFNTVDRLGDKHNSTMVFLTGYPEITGSLDGAENYGYK